MAGTVEKHGNTIVVTILITCLFMWATTKIGESVGCNPWAFAAPSKKEKSSEVKKVSLVKKCETLCGRRGVHKFVRACYPSIQSGSITCECMPVEGENK